MNSTLQRDTAAKLARSDSDEALKVARAISDPWFRAQALSHVARYTAGDPCKLAIEAERAAALCDDDFKRSAVRAWEVAALAERGKVKEARTALLASVKQATLATPPGSRSEALTLLLHAATRIGINETMLVAQALLSVLSVDSHWRCVRSVKEATAVITQLDSKSANNFVDGISDENTKSKCLAAIREGGMAARPFFW